MARDPSTSNGSRGKPPSRTVKKVAAVSGASKTNPNIPSQALKNSRVHLNGPTSLQGTNNYDLSLGALARNVKYQVGPNSSQQGYLQPGVRAKVGSSWVIGKLSPYRPQGGQDIRQNLSSSMKSDNYGFRFHYNPTSVTLTAVGGTDFAPSTLDIGRQLTASNSTVAFQVLINRSEDASDKRKFGSRMLGKTSFAELGTQYDIEWLFRTINGIFVSEAANASADIGTLLPTPLLLQLSGALQYPVYISGFTVEHLKFTPGLIPIVSLLNITFTRVTNAQIPTGNAATASDPGFASSPGGGGDWGAQPAPSIKPKPKPTGHAGPNPGIGIRR